jgi:hypothetical protein
MDKLTIFILLLTIACSGCNEVNSPSTQRSEIATVIVSPLVLDFGKERYSNSPLYFTLNVENRGNKEITVSEVYRSRYRR